MSNKEILKYIKNQLEQEVERSFIEKNLIEKGGWNKKDVDEAFNELRGSNNMDEQIPKAKKSREESDYVKSESTERLSNNKNKGKVNFTKTFILTATILLLSGGAVFGYFKFFKRPDPDIMLRKAFSNLSEVDSYAYESDMNFSLKSKDGDSLSLIVGSDGVSNVESSLENMKSKHNINLNIAIKSKGNSGMMSIGANFEVRVLDGVVYLLVNQSPSFGLMDLSGIEKQWISLNSTEDVSDSNSLLGLKTENPFSEENREHIKEFVLENPLVKVAEDLGSEEINGEDAYHYRMRVDRENVILLAKEINKLAEEKQEMNTVDIKDLENFLDDQGNDIRGDVWVSESKELPIKIGLNISSVIEEQKKAKENVNNMIASVMGAFPQGDNLSNSSFPQIPEISEYSLRVEIQFSDFNKPVKVLAPKNVQKLEDVLQEMFGFGPDVIKNGNNESKDF